MIAGIVGFVGYFSMFMSNNPTLPIMYLIVSLAGLGEIGMVVGSLSLVTSDAVPKHIRGSVAGISTFCGALGILISTKLGGYLFDEWTESAPFFLIAVGHAISTFVALIIIISDVLKTRKAVSESGSQDSFLSALSRLDNAHVQLSDSSLTHQ